MAVAIYRTVGRSENPEGHNIASPPLIGISFTTEGILGASVSINISSVVEFLRRWVLKSKMFGQESTYSKDFFFKSVDELKFIKKCQNCTFKLNF